ncbi:MAG: hypothetical protein SF053_07130 [Bacteroidia bacterium]|nr:hypothetical protein [Bacteroidia bacterium]
MIFFKQSNKIIYFKALILTWLGVISSDLPAQNLFPNPSFEQYTTCPSSYNQVSRLQHWAPAMGTPDFFNCAFSGVTARSVPSLGTGSVGIWGGRGYTTCAGGVYAEMITAALVSPLQAGMPYELSADVQIDGLGTGSTSPNACTRLGFYFYHSSQPPTLSGTCSPALVPQVSIPCSDFQQGNYQTFTWFFTPAQEYDRVLIGIFDNPGYQGATCTNYASNRMYLNLDRLLLQASSILAAAQPELTATQEGSVTRLSWELPEGTWTAGNMYISDSHHTDTVSLDMVVSEWWDMADRTGRVEYLLEIKDEAGHIARSAPITIWQIPGSLSSWLSADDGGVHLHLRLPASGEVSVVWRDITGRWLADQSIRVSAGVQMVPLPGTETWPPGCYLLQWEYQQAGGTLVWVKPQ